MKKHVATFEDHLWDRLDLIQSYNRKSLDKLNAVRQFGVNYQRVIDKFAKGLKKCGQELVAEMIKGADWDKDTSLTQACLTMCAQLEQLAAKI